MEAPTSNGQTSLPQAGKKEKRFQCPHAHCQRLFARLEHLQRHERIRKSYGRLLNVVIDLWPDSGVKPFKCAECDYSLTRRYAYYPSRQDKR